MKVLLIDPPGAGHGLNAGLASIASYLKQYGHELKVLDVNNDRENIEERTLKILEWKPDVIGISVIFTFNKPRVFEIAKLCKQHHDAPIMLGGPGATIDYEELLKAGNGCIDWVAIGEAEETILEFTERLKDGKDWKDMEGIAYFNEGGTDADASKGVIVKNKFREFIKNLDDLPFPDYTDFDTFNSKFEKKIDTYVIITSRGCPYDCVFCANKTISRRRFRMRSAQNVVDEFKHARDFYKTKTILIGDDNYTLDMNRAKEICRLLIKQDVIVPYEMYDGIRADKVDYELAYLLKKSGCREVSIGIENGDEETFKYVQKGEKLEDIERCCKILKEVGIPTRGFVIIGLINTTKESDLRSIKFVEKLGIRANWNVAIYYPGMQLYDWVMKNGRLLKQEIAVEKQLVQCPPVVFFDTLEYPAEDRIFVYKLANLRCKNYYFLYGRNKDVSWFNKFGQIMKVAWEVDRKRVPFYAYDYWATLAKIAIRKHKKEKFEISEEEKQRILSGPIKPPEKKNLLSKFKKNGNGNIVNGNSAKTKVSA